MHTPSAPWEARLSLAFQRRGETTVLTSRRHTGPLRVQKPLYPEGPSPCQVLILHPPSGIVGGDQLHIDIAAEAGSQALLTTPGAGKWYRSGGAEAVQSLDFRLETEAALEWLPQETIFFDGALGKTATQVHLEGTARFFGWEVICLGRRASGERFRQGHLSLETRIRRDDTLLWLERGRLAGSDPLLDSPVGLGGKSVCATLVAAGTIPDSSLLDACRAVPLTESDAQGGITQLPDLLVARYLGHSSEAARQWLVRLWSVMRPALLAREAVVPRIWNT